jgi:hypothetical protein
LKNRFFTSIAAKPSAAQRPVGSPTRSSPNPRGPRILRWHIGVALTVSVSLVAGIALVLQNWPYRHRKIQPLLEDVFGSQVKIGHYHRTYFPHPGFMATDIILRRKSAPNQLAIGSVKSLFVQGSWIDLLLLQQRVERVVMTGVHLELPPPGSQAAREDFPNGSSSDFTGPDTAIGQLEIHNSFLDVLQTNGGRISFPIETLEIEPMQKGLPMRYTVDMENAIPHGHIHATGSFGPLNSSNIDATPVSGQFMFNGVQLKDVGNISGTLSSSGHFDGQLASIRAEAETRTPDFAVNRGMPTAVEGRVQCMVNGVNGDVTYQSMNIRLGGTEILVNGSTQGRPKKSTVLDVSIPKGHAEDLLRPFLTRAVPLTGWAALHAHVFLAPSNEATGFWQRLHVDGAFDAPAENLVNPQMKKDISDFSQRAQGQQPSQDETDAVSGISGTVSIRDEIASTQALNFRVAGPQAHLVGTFAFHTSTVHLTGNLAMESDISHATTGFKSFLLKPLSPLFKKKKAGAVIPIAVTGTPGHYSVSEDVLHTK